MAPSSQIFRVGGITRRLWFSLRLCVCVCVYHNILITACKHLLRVITVGIGQVLLASATRGFSSYIKLAYCSSAQKVLGPIPSWAPIFFLRVSLLSHILLPS